MITSSNNPQLKTISQLNKKAKLRREHGLYVVEGWKMYTEAPKHEIEKVYIAEHFLEKHPEVLKEHPNCEVVQDKIFTAVSDTQTPQGILCIMRQKKRDLSKILQKENPFLIFLEDLQDPGNVGTIIRTAEGAGVDGVIMTKNCVDIYNPKTIRSTMGSIYRVPFFVIDDMNEVLELFRTHNIKTYAAHLAGKNNYDCENYAEGTAILIGNEGNGLSDHLSEAADCLVRIPMCGQLESLNAAMAAGIFMYEAARQRRNQ